MDADINLLLHIKKYDCPKFGISKIFLSESDLCLILIFESIVLNITILDSNKRYIIYEGTRLSDMKLRYDLHKLRSGS